MASKAVSALGERALVERLRKLHDADGSSGIGDDCAVIPFGGRTLVATTDITFDGVHYPIDAPPRLKGWYAAAVNLSDIAAMGAKPAGLLVAYGLPKGMPANDFFSLARAFDRCARAYGTRVIGGDTKGSSTLTVCVTALGETQPGGALLRSGARDGDILVLTGRIGRAHEWLRRGGNHGLGRMLYVEPRVAEGAALAAAGATSCVDLSDGLALSAHLLSEASGIGMELDMDEVPFYSGIPSSDKLAAASYGGDFELLATVPEARFAAAKKAVEKSGGTLAVVGKAGGRGVRYISGGKARALPKSGFEHLRGHGK